MQACNEKSQYKADPRPGDDTARCLPMPHGKIDRQRGGKEGNKIEHDRKGRHHQGNGIITGSVIFQAFYFPFAFTFFKACRAQVPAVERHITQGAHKPATGGTRRYRLFVWMIVASGLVAYLQRFTGRAWGQWPVKGRKNIRS